MKYNKKKIKQCADWVRVNGLYPQQGGAPIKQFCAAMGITRDTYLAWMKKEEFAEAIEKAQNDYRQETTAELVNALKRRALGFEYVLEKKEGRAQLIKEYDPVTGKKIKEYTTEKVVTHKVVREEVHVSPDTGAAIFLLTNVDPDNWKNRQNKDTTLSGEINLTDKPRIVFGDGPSEIDDQPEEE